MCLVILALPAVGAGLPAGAAFAEQAACAPASSRSIGGASAQVCTLAGPGGAQRVFLIAPARPRAALVMFVGGTGQLGLSADGRFRHGANVLVRTRADWVARGFAVVIPDAPGPGSQRGRRSGAEFAGAGAAVLALARERFAVPLVVVGTSQGSIAAAKVASVAPAGEIAGLVLMESVSRGDNLETVFDTQPEAVRAPVLVVANATDACPITPPGDAGRIAAAFVKAPSVHVLRVSGGTAGLGPCTSLSAHGYRGIEAGVVARIAAWLDARLPPARDEEQNPTTCPGASFDADRHGGACGGSE
ncbi:alpha/beta hydrolase [Xanthobacter sp. V4C-4]|uniref:alpha/beta hydrolase n=1 Tax=Xanthobacter cornucopiae TaxID=3119924 RepID=UPI00372B741E